MAVKNRRTFAVAQAALRDIQRALDLSVLGFGRTAAKRYDALIKRALRDLKQDPERAGSRILGHSDAGTVRAYYLTSSRLKVVGKPVGDPRHLFLYRVTPTEVVVDRLLHDANDLANVPFD